MPANCPPAGHGLERDGETALFDCGIALDHFTAGGLGPRITWSQPSGTYTVPSLARHEATSYTGCKRTKKTDIQHPLKQEMA